MKIVLTIGIAAGILVFSFAPAHAQMKYTFKDIATDIGVKEHNPTIVGMNASGVIAGTAIFQTGTPSFNGQPTPVIHAFTYDGSLHDLGTLSGDKSEAFAINASGQEIGRAHV